MRFKLMTSTLAIFSEPRTPFGKFSNINHNVSRGVACLPVVSPAMWKVEWNRVLFVTLMVIVGTGANIVRYVGDDPMEAMVPSTRCRFAPP
jgi:hypothetical protein